MFERLNTPGEIGRFHGGLIFAGQWKIGKKSGLNFTLDRPFILR